jgi:hypothetical protein
VRKRLLAGAVALVAYDTLVRPRMLTWGATPEETEARLSGDDIPAEVMTHHTRAVTIEASPDEVWPWIAQIGDGRAGFYSYDGIERLLGMGPHVEGRRSATRIHPELQALDVGDSVPFVARFRVSIPVTDIEPGHYLVIGTWAFVLVPLPDGRTRLLMRTRDTGWARLAVPRRFGLLRGLGAVIDYLVGEPLHFVMERGMMLGIKERAERPQGA